MESDRAEIFSQTWASVGPELVEKLKSNIFSPKKVRLHIIRHPTVFIEYLSFILFTERHKNYQVFLCRSKPIIKSVFNTFFKHLP